MGEHTRIEWAHHTFNPWRGCTRISDGCRHCYAETLSRRNPDTLGVWGPGATRVIAGDEYWHKPRRWNAVARHAGTRRRVVCLSMGDFFEDRPELIEPRLLVWKLIAQTPSLDWLLLTKRPELISEALPNNWGSGWPNVWLGVSVEHQEALDQRFPELYEIPAVVHFISAEPLLGPIDLTAYLFDPICPLINWVIVGGESGRAARPMHPDWARGIRDQCSAAGIPFFFKQWGEFCPYERSADDTRWLGQDGRQCDNGDTLESFCITAGNRIVGFRKVGKKAAGLHLDGTLHNALPEVPW